MRRPTVTRAVTLPLADRLASLGHAEDALAALHLDARRAFMAGRTPWERYTAACTLSETGVALSHVRRITREVFLAPHHGVNS